MTDVAALGFQVDSSGLTKATGALDNMSNAAKRAGDAAKGMSDTTTNASARVASAAKGFDAHSNSAKKAAAATGLARDEMVNLSRQVQDIGVSLASGQSPFMVMIQQGTQVGDIFANTKGSIAGFAAQIGRAAFSIGGLVVGVAGLAAGLAILSYSAISNEKALANLSERAGSSVANMRALQSAAAFKGVSGSDFTSVMEKLSMTTAQAQRGVGALADEFRAMGSPVGSTVENMMTIADLIKRAGNDQQKYYLAMTLGVPPTREWVQFLGQGSDAIKRAASEAVQFDEGAAAQLVQKSRELNESWNRFWEKFGGSAYSAAITFLDKIVSAADAVKKLYDMMPSIPGSLSLNPLISSGVIPLAMNAMGIGGKVSGASAGGSSVKGMFDAAFAPGAFAPSSQTPSGPKTLEEQRAEISRAQQRLSLMGQLMTVEDQLKQKELELAAAGLSGAGVARRRRGGTGFCGGVRHRISACAGRCTSRSAPARRR